MCRKQLPTIEERLERVIGDIGPQNEIPEDLDESDEDDEDDFFYGPSATQSKNRNQNSLSPFEKSAQNPQEEEESKGSMDGDHFFFQQSDEKNQEYYSPIDK